MIIIEYTIHELSKLAGVSKRTIRYYDEFGILKPKRINSSGYRIYGGTEVDRLQQIMFFKELGFGLEEIKNNLDTEDFDRIKVLESHLNELIIKRNKINILIKNVKKTILTTKGECTMTDKEKFVGLKKKDIEENETKYGKEIRKKYGDDRVDKSNKKYLSETEYEHNEIQKNNEKFALALKEAVLSKDVRGTAAKEVFNLHKQMLCFFWDEYSNEAHIGVTEMYLSDERFKKYYEDIVEGGTQFLCDTVKEYCKHSN